MNLNKWRIRIFTLIGIIAAGMILFYGWWVWPVGAAAVWRIITSDESSIEDYAQFPQRSLTASKTPFHFLVNETADTPLHTATFDGQPELPLDDFSRQTHTVAFLLIQDDAVLKESCFQGYDKSTPTMALGHSGQFVYVKPAKNLIIVRLGANRGGLEKEQ